MGVLLVAALAITAAGGAWAYLQDDDSPTTAPAARTVDPSDVAAPGEDPRAELVRGFCADPGALGDDLAGFVPGEGAVAYVQVPQPPSSTEPVDNVVVQVSPTVGEPTLSLGAAINLVSVAVCTEQTATEPTVATCDFELTNPDAIGEERTAPLLADTYRLRLHDLRSGEVLAEGELTSDVATCPRLAYLDVDGVSNALPTSQVLAWIALQVPGIVPD